MPILCKWFDIWCRAFQHPTYHWAVSSPNMICNVKKKMSGPIGMLLERTSCFLDKRHQTFLQEIPLWAIATKTNSCQVTQSTTQIKKGRNLNSPPHFSGLRIQEQYSSFGFSRNASEYFVASLRTVAAITFKIKT